MEPPLHLGEAAIDKQFRSRYVAAVVRGEKDHGLSDLVGCAKPGVWNSWRRSFKSVVHVLANERTTAFVAL